jgi:type II secretory ATPase GspE/PulE/Tfp pilus assembly ATPase PilB-like protein/Zn-finger nucleic acid-binding protein
LKESIRTALTPSLPRPAPTLRCPRDGAVLAPRVDLELSVQACAVCDGCWLDSASIHESPHRGNIHLDLSDARDSGLACIRCGGRLYVGNHVADPTLVLDHCWGCRGTWCDAGELAQLLRTAGRRTTPLVAQRFDIRETITRGRFAVLQRALDVKRGTRVVLRRWEERTSKQARDQMILEGRRMAALDHRNLPRVLEVVEDGDFVVLVLEDFEAWPLAEFVTGLGMPASEKLLWRLLDQMLSVIGYLHGQDPPIVHRDLRPDALLITGYAILKVVDFGLATFRPVAGQTVFKLAGSPEFAAPEQLGGAPSAPRNDIYSIGATLFYIGTGTPPPASRDLYDGNASCSELARLRPDLSPSFVELVNTMMHPEADARPASVEAVEELLRRLEGGMDAAPAPFPPTGVPVSVAAPQPPPPAETKEARSAAAWLRSLFRLPRKGGARVSAAPSDPEPAELDKFEFMDLEHTDLDRNLGQLLPESVCRSIEGICVGHPIENEIVVAVKDPTSVHIYDHISYATQGRLRPRLIRADGMMLDLAQEWIFRIPAFADKLAWLEWLERKKLEAETLDVKSVGEVTFGVEDITSPIIAAVDRIIKEAISAGASDIHLETFENEMVVRYRMDGVLHEISTFEPKEAAAIVKRVKILANLDIAQDRITQGGRISVSVKGQELDLRVSIVPVPNGESIVLRLLKKGAFNLTLKDLGFNERDDARFRKVLSQPYGMVLVSGPTGSGKSTTLYASLAEIQRPDRKLLTIEDPIEYQMPRITQVQVNISSREEEKRVTFARALREFLRQDPDVILVGEIRDPETAAISVQAALTGHMLLSTIHTNDSVGIVARLRDMGVEPYLIGSVLLGGVAQRLCRKICKECKEEIPVPATYREIFEKEQLEVPHLYHGKGCQVCHGTGYRGRLGLYELLEITSDVRELISAMARDEEVREAATRHGFRTLLQDGYRKAASGLVTLDEVQRVCMSI